MSGRDGESSEMDFSEGELAEMNADVAGREGEARPRRRSMLRIPVDQVPRPIQDAVALFPTETTFPTYHPDEGDEIVEHAFSNGGTAEGVVPAQLALIAQSDLRPHSAALDDEDATVEVEHDDSPFSPDREAAPLPAVKAPAAPPAIKALVAAAAAPAVPAVPAAPPVPQGASLAALVRAVGGSAPATASPDDPARPTSASGVISIDSGWNVPSSAARADETPAEELDGEELEGAGDDDGDELESEEIEEMDKEEVSSAARIPPRPPEVTALSPTPVPSVAPPMPAVLTSAPPMPSMVVPAPVPAAPNGDLAVRPAQIPTPPPAPSAEEAPLRGRKKRRTKQWFEEIFDDDYLRTLPYLTPRQTERESVFVRESLALATGANVLDLACGYGRHAMELASKACKVTGLDLSLPLLIRAADAARRAGLTINFIHGDMREMTFENEFDAAYCMFTSFGFFDDDTNRKVAANLQRAIKPGGKLLLEVVNRDYLVRDLPTRVWWQGENCVVLEEVDFNYFSSRLQVQRSIIFEDGRQVEQEISIRAYSLHEIGKILHHSGFRVTEVSGGLALRGKFFGADSRQLIVLAEKK